jgi:RNA polymerase sigma factor (sigma-70 family)
MSPRFRGVDCDPQDVTQQFFQQFFKTAVKRYQPDKPFFPYAYVMLVRICITHARRAQKRATRQLPTDLASRSRPSWRHAARKESRRRITQALRHLSKEERALIADKYWRCKSSAQIGARRGLSAPQVDQQMFQIRGKLRAWLSPDDWLD